MARPIMVMGTMSNSGKSLLVTALCRIFHQDGYRVAPFKSQNMALNSYVTWDGGEMGRAQVAQAEACGRQPDVRMNPILLKPTSDVGSQVILRGQVEGTYRARDYFAKKKDYIPLIRECYDELASDCDIMVIEGAGSPAEINLKQDDIVNMGMAKLVDAPVLLVGDIDPGGVFAQLYGTVALLEKEEQARIKGLIINKFRGDKSLLDPGITMLEERLGIPVLGTVPYLTVDIDDEDSMSGFLLQKQHHKQIDLAVLRFPRISNFTDFSPLEQHRMLGVRFVESVQELGEPDMILLPGTKNTLGDLQWMKETGLFEAVRGFAARGGAVFGICGGFQMLGEELSDPEGVESAPGRLAQGLGLLPMRTVFAKEKTRTRRQMTLQHGPCKGCYVDGYEIHMGVSRDGSGNSLIECSKDNVYGTYLHGFFDEAAPVEALATYLAKGKGLPEPTEHLVSHRAYKEAQYDLLADALRAHLDMDRIYEIIGIKA
ncbi:MAG: cobyric acid synthase [Lachnospiraceae bacterium]|nr:cobyric acid synthase [Lachnospiraceae bacterium]